MAKVNITRDDIKKNSYNLLLTVSYGIIIAIVYCYWSWVKLHRIWLTLIILLVIGLVTYLFGFLWTHSVAKKRIQAENIIDQKEQISE